MFDEGEGIILKGKWGILMTRWSSVTLPVGGAEVDLEIMVRAKLKGRPFSAECHWWMDTTDNNSQALMDTHYMPDNTLIVLSYLDLIATYVVKNILTFISEETEAREGKKLVLMVTLLVSWRVWIQMPPFWSQSSATLTLLGRALYVLAVRTHTDAWSGLRVT